MDVFNLTKIQKKTLPAGLFGILLLTMSDKVMMKNYFFSAVLLIAAGVVFYLLNCKKRENKKLVGEVEPIAVCVMLLLSGVSVLTNTRMVFTAVIIIMSISMILIGTHDLFVAKETVFSWIALIFGILGIITILVPYKISTTPVHLTGIMLFYYEAKIFLGEIYGC